MINLSNCGQIYFSNLHLSSTPDEGSEFFDLAFNTSEALHLSVGCIQNFQCEDFYNQKFFFKVFPLILSVRALLFKQNQSERCSIPRSDEIFAG